MFETYATIDGTVFHRNPAMPRNFYHFALTCDSGHWEKCFASLADGRDWANSVRSGTGKLEIRKGERRGSVYSFGAVAKTLTF